MKSTFSKGLKLLAVLMLLALSACDTSSTPSQPVSGGNSSASSAPAGNTSADNVTETNVVQNGQVDTPQTFRNCSGASEYQANVTVGQVIDLQVSDTTGNSFEFGASGELSSPIGKVSAEIKAALDRHYGQTINIQNGSQIAMTVPVPQGYIIIVHRYGMGTKRSGIVYVPGQNGPYNYSYTVADISNNTFEPQKTPCSGVAESQPQPPAQAPQQPTQPQPPAQPPPSASCPTSEQAKSMLGGIDVHQIGEPPGDYCAWKWDGTGVATCPQGWDCTFDLVDTGTIVLYRGGDGVSQKTRGGTFRYILAYPSDHRFQNICNLLTNEENYGRGQTPSYETFAGNFSCSN
jgi:hypothetical protein